jgi:hypothetical protein
VPHDLPLATVSTGSEKEPKPTGSRNRQLPMLLSRAKPVPRAGVFKRAELSSLTVVELVR